MHAPCHQIKNKKACEPIDFHCYNTQQLGEGDIILRPSDSSGSHPALQTDNFQKSHKDKMHSFSLRFSLHSFRYLL